MVTLEYSVPVLFLLLDDGYNEVCLGERNICQGNPSSRFGSSPVQTMQSLSNRCSSGMVCDWVSEGFMNRASKT